jgi:formimidoylglutamate deiminase
MMGHSEAVVGLCPTTEANLGDGIFPAQEFLAANGAFGIGSDSHVSVNALEELRWLEYGQRLKHRRRNRLSVGERPEVADTLYGAALHGGAQAMGQHTGAIAVGKRADLVALDGDHPMLANVTSAKLLGRWLFGGNEGWVRHVMAGGKWVVRDRHHTGEEAAHQAFTEAMSQLMAA